MSQRRERTSRRGDGIRAHGTRGVAIPRIRDRRTLVLVAIGVQTLVLLVAWTVTFRIVRGQLATAVQDYIIDENAAFVDDLAQRLPVVDTDAEFGSDEWQRLQGVIETAGQDLPAGGFACLLDADGQILCHPEIRDDQSLRQVNLGQKLLRTAAEDESREANVRLADAGEGTYSGRVSFFAEGTHYVATKKIPGTEMRLLVHQPEAELLGASNDLTGSVLFTGVIAVGVIALVGAGGLLTVIRSYDSTFEEMNRRLKSSLQIARDIQLATLPDDTPSLAGYSIAAWSDSADETGGDTYDLIPLKQSGDGLEVLEAGAEADEVVCLLADATGHGIGAALAISEFRALARMSVRTGTDAARGVEHVNGQLLADLPSGRFVTAWVGRIRAGDPVVSSFAAGQAPILVRRADGTIESFDADEPPLGAFDGLDGSSGRSIELNLGDALVIVSDGMHEAPNAAGERFGLDRLERLLSEAPTADANGIIAHLRDGLERFVGEAEQDDDRTAVVVLRT